MPTPVPATRILFSFLVALLVLGRPAMGQRADPDATVAAVDAAEQHYAASFVGRSQLYNGPEYIDYARKYHAQVGHQFFSAPERQAGTVFYNGVRFGTVLLNYDVVLDQVVVKAPNSPLTLRLVNEKVRYFTLGDHFFTRLLADSSAGKVIRTGYYEVLLDGPVQVAARRVKHVREQIVQLNIDVLFEPADKLFLRQAGTYHAVGSKGAVLRLFSDHGKEVQSYVKAQKLSFKKALFESSVVRLTQYYASLLPR